MISSCYISGLSEEIDSRVKGQKVVQVCRPLTMDVNDRTERVKRWSIKLN